MSKYILQDEKVFLTDFLMRCRGAKRRVWVQAMIVESGKVMSDWIQILKKLPKKLDLRLHYDWISTRSMHGSTPLLPMLSADKRREFQALQLRNLSVLRGVEKLGTKVTMINRPMWLSAFLPITGRNHTKIYVVDDAVWMGGCNFMDKTFETSDAMIRVEDAELKQVLCEHFELVNKRRPKKHREVLLQSGDKFLADCGKRGSSIIYAHAVANARKAQKSISFVSQYLPTGELLEVLVEKGKSGVKVEMYTNPIEHSHFNDLPHTIPYQNFLRKTQGIKNLHIYHLKNDVHAKILLVDEQVVMLGSHNFVDTGVTLGTEEIALESFDDGFAGEVAGYIERLKEL